MLGAKIMQGLILVASFMVWDAWLKERFYGMLVEEGETAGLAEIAMGYAIVFVSALVLSMVVCKFLGLNQTEDTGDAY